MHLLAAYVLSCRKFAQHYFPVLRYSNGDALECILSRSEEANAKPVIEVHYADGRTDAFDMKSVRDADVIRKLAGTDVPVPADAFVPRRRKGGSRRTRASTSAGGSAAAGAAALSSGAATPGSTPASSTKLK